MCKKTILIDLDSLLDIYTGNFSEDCIPEIKSRAKEFIKRLSCNFEIKLFTARNKLLASKWLIRNDLDRCVTNIINTKESCRLYIDDKGIRCSGDDGLHQDIHGFRLWYKD